jgi:hypothetical protein
MLPSIADARRGCRPSSAAHQERCAMRTVTSLFVIFSTRQNQPHSRAEVPVPAPEPAPAAAPVIPIPRSVSLPLEATSFFVSLKNNPCKGHPFLTQSHNPHTHAVGLDSKGHTRGAREGQAAAATRKTKAPRERCVCVCVCVCVYKARPNTHRLLQRRASTRMSRPHRPPRQRRWSAQPATLLHNCARSTLECSSPQRRPSRRLVRRRHVLDDGDSAKSLKCPQRLSV